jgi:outer membrane receptor protein involved in Fe transport
MGQSSPVAIDIPEGSLVGAISILSRQSGISVGMTGPIPVRSVKALRGRMRPAAALAKLLRGTGLRAVATDDTSFRLETAPTRNSLASPDTAPVVPAPDIIVTGLKRTQGLATIPVSVSVIALDGNLQISALPRSADIAGSTESFTLTNVGAGRNRPFIRGVADSPFSGSSQSTVAIQLNDARIAFNAPDPDLRLVDIDRVEILKGPQGPLYGSGALGGVYRVITRHPDLDTFSGSAAAHIRAVQTGESGVGGQAIVNFPIVKGRLAVRAVAYRDFEPGWIDNADGRHNSNDTHVAGERVTLRWQAFDDWALEVMALSQRLDQDDTQYVTRSAESLRRTSLFAEPSDNDFRMATATISGRIDDIDVLSSTSRVNHKIGATFDASASAANFGLSGPVKYSDERTYTIFNQEIRLSRMNMDGLSWVAGASWVQAETEFDGVLDTSDGTVLPAVTIHQEISELAAFAELSLKLGPDWNVSGGGRLFRSIARNERSKSGPVAEDRQIKNGFTPSISLGWSPSSGKFFFLRFAGALRPGGISPSVGTENDHFSSDELMNLDLGWRIHSADQRLSIDGAAYATRWDHIQSDYLLDNGLVATHNAGDGRIYGVESNIRWKLAHRVSLDGGVTVQRARLVKPSSGTVIGDDGRLPVVPGLSGRLGVSRSFDIDRWQGHVGARINYIGSSRLSFDQGLDRHMGDYATAGVNATVSDGRWTLRASIENLLNGRGDSFAFGNPFSIRLGPQFTPIRPRTLNLAIERQW